MLVDTHCHLHLLEEPAAGILERARQEGVGAVVDVGVDLPSSRQAVANAGRFEAVVASAGVHPHDAVTLTSEVEAELRQLLAGERVVAVGGTGLDCFSGDERIAMRALEAGYTVSFAGTVTFKNAAVQRAACAAVPLDRMVLETDSPFLSPHPFRGQPNRPWRVAVTAAAVAEIHGLTQEEVATVTSATASRAFGLAAVLGPDPDRHPGDSEAVDN